MFQSYSNNLSLQNKRTQIVASFNLGQNFALEIATKYTGLFCLPLQQKTPIVTNYLFASSILRNTQLTILSVTSASSQSAISILVTWQKWTNQRCILIYWDNGFVTSSAQLESWLAHFCHVTKILIADWLLSEVTVITTGIVLDTQRRFSS